MADKSASANQKTPVVPDWASKEFRTQEGIPIETFEHRLGNRSALAWEMDEYGVSIRVE
ncbi:MAG: hypothetical protein HY735_36740 [Verrucomicrobia bacterium]|nr:hypothetical protein [Verrucomicrobiota bacterium]